ncbi:MAG TPA: hypothetical protein VE053_12730 [Allosphingosinicella sp.]|nr:hypothetical protein [Allosphingosinicella sp.]
MLRDSAFLSRRVLLAGLGAGAVGVAASAAPIGRAPAGGSTGPASWWDRTFQSLHSGGLAEWTGLVGETFTVDTPNGSHLLRVAAVSAFPKSPGSRPAGLGRSQAFTVAFELVAGPPLPASDALYQLVHRTFPPLPLYLGAPVKFGQKTRVIALLN